MPCEKQNQRLREYYQEKGYDAEDLEFFLESMNGWTRNYHHAAYIKMPFFDKEEHQQFTKDAAAFYHWDYTLLDGDLSLLKRFLDGDWAPEDFLVVPPGCSVAASNDSGIITLCGGACSAPGKGAGRMKILLAPDSFKESMTAVEAAEAMERGVRRIYPNAECVKLPFADGGEGTAECLVMMTGGEMKTAAVTGPLGETVHACYGIINGDTAVIETAECCGTPNHAARPA